MQVFSDEPQSAAPVSASVTPNVPVSLGIDITGAGISDCNGYEISGTKNGKALYVKKGDKKRTIFWSKINTWIIDQPGKTPCKLSTDDVNLSGSAIPSEGIWIAHENTFVAPAPNMQVFSDT